MTPLLSLFAGMGAGLALIVAIGSQNAHVLRVGVRSGTGTVLPVVAVCVLSDAVLVSAGVLGVGALAQALPFLVEAIRVLGAVFLLAYGLTALRRSLRPGTLVAADESAGPGRGGAVATTLALTWLNPHVYLDTVVLLGSLAQQQESDLRWWWTIGAIAGSFLWFTALGGAARLLRPLFARPGAWRVLDLLVAAVMLTLGVRLALEI
ncbi:LysE/ArgO family amino acid transporter [Nocardiopsis kunsanensis]|uniref:LysE/ArgO family amino acid transporter n=1 Tax=Nocardiopsis kunsanensis TaxID=141693 RepID=UPI00034C4AF6|nr:LysE/ArgO family amino acid transporter [Nocardiopsis kunsanensis]